MPRSQGIPRESHAVPQAYPVLGATAEDVHLASYFWQAVARAPSAPAALPS